MQTKSSRSAFCTLAALWLATIMVTAAVAPAAGYAKPIDRDYIIAY